MKRLHIELLLALQLDKPHGRARRRLRDPFGVTIIVLLRFDIGPDVLGRHQPHIVPMSGEDATEMMGPAARFHRDHARRKFRSQCDQRFAFCAPPQYERAGGVGADDAADVLAQIDAKNRDIHAHSSS
jgi:hypothetical protein